MTFAIDQNPPTECDCGNKEFEKFNEYKEDYYVVEYSLKCKECGKVVGHWAYGYWLTLGIDNGPK